MSSSTPLSSGPAGAGDWATSLTAEELRVLACLVEKSHTTPDQYPLSTNALTTACNQKTSREPVVDYPANRVDRLMQLLRDGGWARSIRGSGNRTFKHRHVIDERLGLGTAEQALVAVLALRGPQSAGELKTRTERYHPFADPGEVEAVLRRLAERATPLVVNVGRGAGQSQDRWVQLLGPTPDGAEAPPPAADAAVPTASPSSQTPAVAAAGPSTVVEAAPAPTPDPGDDEVGRLRSRVAELERRIDRLERELGLDDG
ncbi:MAG: DUF480 domain-containing protein [Actinomycetota bacterium]